LRQSRRCHQHPGCTTSRSVDDVLRALREQLVRQRRNYRHHRQRPCRSRSSLAAAAVERTAEMTCRLARQQNDWKTLLSTDTQSRRTTRRHWSTSAHCCCPQRCLRNMLRHLGRGLCRQSCELRHKSRTTRGNACASMRTADSSM
jgi:hypothetical protein